MNNHPLSRRDVLKGAAALAASAFVPNLGAALTRNAIAEENAKPGTRDWMLAETQIDPETKYRCPWLEGYCSRPSVRAGETISFHVSANPATRFTIEFYRLGHYGGDGGRYMTWL